jgi:hypothetical protein
LPDMAGIVTGPRTRKVHPHGLGGLSGHCYNGPRNNANDRLVCGEV